MNAAPIPKFTESLNTMRSAKMPLAMYLQSVEGLNKLYGPNADQLFLGSADLKVIFRVSDNLTSEYMSAQIGDTEQRSFNATESVQRSQSGGRGGLSDSVSRSQSSGYSSSTARIIDPSELLGLNPGKAIVFYRGPVLFSLCLAMTKITRQPLKLQSIHGRKFVWWRVLQWRLDLRKRRPNKAGV